MTDCHYLRSDIDLDDSFWDLSSLRLFISFHKPVDSSMIALWHPTGHTIACSMPRHHHHDLAEH